MIILSTHLYELYLMLLGFSDNLCIKPRKISWTWSLWKTWAKKTNNHSQIMAIALIKSDSAGFFAQVSSQNHGAIPSHQMGEC